MSAETVERCRVCLLEDADEGYRVCRGCRGTSVERDRGESTGDEVADAIRDLADALREAFTSSYVTGNVAESLVHIAGAAYVIARASNPDDPVLKRPPTVQSRRHRDTRNRRRRSR